jgi:nitrate reductase assembly molybdenum cofactor insertion protein NarJ
MRGILRDLEITESVELPDHVSHMLSVIARAEPGLSRALARTVIAPALGKIEAGFSKKENPYYGVIAGLHAYLDECYADDSATEQEDTSR